MEAEIKRSSEVMAGIEAERLEKLRAEHQRMARVLVEWGLERHVINDTVPSTVIEYLTTTPEVVKIYEIGCEFEPTGDSKLLLERYQATKYTRQYAGADPNLCLVGAAEHGHLDIVKRSIEQGANQFNQAITDAAGNGHLEVVQHLLAVMDNRQIPPQLNMALAMAAGGGHLEIFQLLVERGASGFELPMLFAKISRHDHIVQYIRDQGYSTDFPPEEIAETKTTSEEPSQIATHFINAYKAACSN